MNNLILATLLNESAEILTKEEFTPPQPQAPAPAPTTAPTTQQTPSTQSQNTGNIDELVDILNTIRSAKSFSDPSTYNAIGSVWNTTSPQVQQTILDFLNKLGSAATETLKVDQQTIPTQQGNGLPPQQQQQPTQTQPQAAPAI